MPPMRLLILVRAALLLLLVSAAPQAGARTRPALPPPAPAPVLWEIHDADTRIYLFGTVHALPRGVEWFRPDIADALDRSDRLVLETLPPSDAEFARTVEQMARRTTPLALIARVPPESRPAFQTLLARLRPPPLDSYEDWYVAVGLTNLQSAADGLDPRVGVEAVLAERARLGAKPITALETPQEQLLYFDALPQADQQQLLLAAIDELTDGGQRIDAMLAAWLSGDAPALAALINSGFERSPILRQWLIADRNARWASWIAGQMATTKGTLFVAVGAGHLAGPGSLIERLRAYRLEAARVGAPPPAQPRRQRPRAP
jgi:uncharacterized protein YbaP (TraB family)